MAESWVYNIDSLPDQAKTMQFLAPSGICNQAASLVVAKERLRSQQDYVGLVFCQQCSSFIRHEYGRTLCLPILFSVLPNMKHFRARNENSIQFISGTENRSGNNPPSISSMTKICLTDTDNKTSLLVRSFLVLPHDAL